MGEAYVYKCTSYRWYSLFIYWEDNTKTCMGFKHANWDHNLSTAGLLYLSHWGHKKWMMMMTTFEDIFEGQDQMKPTKCQFRTVQEVLQTSFVYNMKCNALSILSDTLVCACVALFISARDVSTKATLPGADAAETFLHEFMTQAVQRSAILMSAVLYAMNNAIKASVTHLRLNQWAEITSIIWKMRAPLFSSGHTRHVPGAPPLGRLPLQAYRMQHFW